MKKKTSTSKHSKLLDTVIKPEGKGFDMLYSIPIPRKGITLRDLINQFGQEQLKIGKANGRVEYRNELREASEKLSEVMPRINTQPSSLESLLSCRNRFGY